MQYKYNDILSIIIFIFSLYCFTFMTNFFQNLFYCYFGYLIPLCTGLSINYNTVYQTHNKNSVYQNCPDLPFSHPPPHRLLPGPLSLDQKRRLGDGDLDLCFLSQNTQSPLSSLERFQVNKVAETSLVHFPISYWRQQAFLKLDTHDSCLWISCLLNQGLFNSFKPSKHPLKEKLDIHVPHQVVSQVVADIYLNQYFSSTRVKASSKNPSHCSCVSMLFIECLLTV